MNKVIVIGGGPAGMMAAITAKENGNEVVLLEKNGQLGKKLLITGKGRCNITSSLDMEEFIKNTPGIRYKILEPKATSEVLVYPISSPKNTNHDETKEQRMYWILKSIFALVKIYLNNNPTKVAKNTKFPAPKSPPKSLQKAEFAIETNKRLSK